MLGVGLTGKQGHSHGGYDKNGRRSPLVAPYGLMRSVEAHDGPPDTGEMADTGLTLRCVGREKP